MSNFVKRAVAAVDRALFGAAKEQARIPVGIIRSAADHAIWCAFEVGPDYDENYDAAIAACLACGMSRDQAHRVATLVADELEDAETGAEITAEVEAEAEAEAALDRADAAQVEHERLRLIAGGMNHYDAYWQANGVTDTETAEDDA